MRYILVRRANLRCLLRVRDSIVDFEPFECRRLLRLEPEFPGRFDKEITLLQVVVETTGFHFLAPAPDLRRRFLLAGLIKPFDYFFVAGTLLNLRPEIFSLHAFKFKEHAVQRTVKMILADVPGDVRAAFVDGAAKNGIATNANARTARCFFCEIVSRNFPLHTELFE